MIKDKAGKGRDAANRIRCLLQKNIYKWNLGCQVCLLIVVPKLQGNYNRNMHIYNTLCLETILKNEPFFYIERF